MKSIKIDFNFILQQNEAERMMCNSISDMQRWFKDHPKSKFNITQLGDMSCDVHPEDLEDFKNVCSKRL